MPSAVYFSPQGGCTDAIVKELAAARILVLLAAYQFTSPAILAALIACLDRGVKVRLVNDHQAASTPGWLGKQLAAAGGEVWIDGHHHIFHDKYLVLDGRLVVTGSFNFTVSAEKSNAENVLIVPLMRLANDYRADWEKHRAHATPLAEARLVLSAAYPMPPAED